MNESLKPYQKKEDSHKSAASDKKHTGAIQLKDNRESTSAQLRKQSSNDGKTIQQKSNNTGLPNQLKSGIENLSGHSMDDVKVHYNSSKPAQLNAHAYAQGTDIHVASGQEKHVAHEAWHVVQQKQGRVKPTKQLKSKVNLNDDPGLEKEADVMGAKAMQFKTLNNTQAHSGILSSNLIQKKATTAKIIQPFYASSYLLRFGDVAPKESEAAASSSSSVSSEEHESRQIEYSTGDFSGPWKVCTDTTSKGYRSKADAELGGREPLTILSRLKVIKAPASKKHSYTLSHLIAAEFAGQIKYKDPKNNIRYFPESLEYGNWQKAEYKVKKDGKLGFLQVLGQDESITTVFKMAEHIVSLVAHIFSYEQLVNMEIKLYDVLRGAKYVPKNVSFTYTDYAGGNSFKLSEGGLNAGLAVNGSANPENVLKALKILGVLPESDGKGKELHVETEESGAINNSANILELVSGFKIKTKRKKTIIAGINRLIKLKDKPSFDLKVALKSYIDKLPEMKAESRVVEIGGANKDYTPLPEG